MLQKYWFEALVMLIWRSKYKKWRDAETYLEEKIHLQEILKSKTGLRGDFLLKKALEGVVEENTVRKGKRIKKRDNIKKRNYFKKHNQTAY